MACFYEKVHDFAILGAVPLYYTAFQTSKKLSCMNPVTIQNMRAKARGKVQQTPPNNQLRTEK